MPLCFNMREIPSGSIMQSHFQTVHSKFPDVESTQSSDYTSPVRLTYTLEDEDFTIFTRFQWGVPSPPLTITTFSLPHDSEEEVKLIVLRRWLLRLWLLLPSRSAWSILMPHSCLELYSSENTKLLQRFGPGWTCMESLKSTMGLVLKVPTDTIHMAVDVTQIGLDCNC